MPNFDALDDINVNINVPDIDFNVDYDFFEGFNLLTWDCALNVMAVCNFGVAGITSVDCSKDINSYTGEAIWSVILFLFQWSLFIQCAIAWEVSLLYH